MRTRTYSNNIGYDTPPEKIGREGKYHSNCQGCGCQLTLTREQIGKIKLCFLCDGDHRAEWDFLNF
jgi:putative hemolysin